MTQTNINYWDCECEKNYIHLKVAGDYCKDCGTWMDEGADSLCSEIASQYNPMNDRKIITHIPLEGVYHGE